MHRGAVEEQALGVCKPSAASASASRTPADVGLYSMALCVDSFCAIALVLICCLSVCTRLCIADESGSVAHNAAAAGSAASLRDQSTSGHTAAAGSSSDASQALSDTAATIERLLLKAEHLRFGIAEGHSPLGSRPRPSPHSFPPHPSLSHSAAADKAADIPAARALYEQAAALGSSTALNELGEMALYGDGGFPANITAATVYFNASAELGNPEAQHHLAIMNWLGLNALGKSDEATAMLYEYFSAMGGNPLAKMSLGYRHLMGISAPKSCEAAVAYYQPVSEEVVLQSVQSPINVVIEKARLADERSRSVPPEEDEDVIQYYQHSAENGDVAAQVALGQLHFYGARGFEQNPERAARYFKAAAAQGDTTAMSSLGQMHVQGLGVAQNNETAFKYLSEAAEKGNAGAQNGLGYLYMHGQGTKQDYKLALKWFKKSAESGNAEAQFHLGAMYFAGLGVDKKYQTALHYFTMAGHQGHTRALYNLAQMHLSGLGTIKSCTIGVKLHKTVAERGNWATVSNDAHRHFLKGNYEQAWMRYARAAEEGHEHAQANSAWMLDQGYGTALAESAIEQSETAADGSAVVASSSPSSRRYLLAHRHWTLAAAQGNVDSLRMLGDYAFAGLGMENSSASADAPPQPDYALALKLYNQAAELRNAQAMFNLGYMHERGLGTSDGLPDFHLAKRFYDSCLEADTEALVPVKLALAHLYARAYWEEYWNGGASVEETTGANADARAASAAANAAKQHAQHAATGGGGASSPSAAQTLPGPLAYLWKTISSTLPLDSLSEWFSRLTSSHGALEIFLSLEDVILAVLCALLAIIVYVRSQR